MAQFPAITSSDTADQRRIRLGGAVLRVPGKTLRADTVDSRRIRVGGAVLMVPTSGR